MFRLDFILFSFVYLLIELNKQKTKKEKDQLKPILLMGITTLCLHVNGNKSIKFVIRGQYK